MAQLLHHCEMLEVYRIATEAVRAFRVGTNNAIICRTLTTTNNCLVNSESNKIATSFHSFTKILRKLVWVRGLTIHSRAV